MGYLMTAGDLRRCLDGVPDEARLHFLILATPAEAGLDADALAEQLGLLASGLSVCDYDPKRDKLDLGIEVRVRLGDEFVTALSFAGAEDGGEVTEPAGSVSVPFYEEVAEGGMMVKRQGLKPDPNRE